MSFSLVKETLVYVETGNTIACRHNKHIQEVTN